MGGVDYASSGHGLIFLHANSAITFNLEAIRRANPGCKLLRFRATAANSRTSRVRRVWPTSGCWSMVNRGFNAGRSTTPSGVFGALVPIGDRDRFLTLAATSANDGIHFDWIIFGDPRLELLPVETKRTKGHGRPLRYYKE